MITSAATTTSWTMMRTLLGIVFLINDIMTFENASTAITEMPITIAGSNFAVTARQEQMPRTCTITGLSFDNGLYNTDLFLLLKSDISIIQFFSVDVNLLRKRNSMKGKIQALFEPLYW